MEPVAPTFVAVQITDATDPAGGAMPAMPWPALVIVERSAPGIEVDLIGGRRSV